MRKGIGIVFGLFWFLMLPANSLSFDLPPSSATKQQREPSEGLHAHKLVQVFGDEFDLDGCQRRCMETLYRGGDTSWWLQYGSCIQDCNSTFWKDYDKRMKKLKDSDPG